MGIGYKAHIGVDNTEARGTHSLESLQRRTVDGTFRKHRNYRPEKKRLSRRQRLIRGAGKREDAVVRNKSGHRMKHKINRRPSQVKKASKKRHKASDSKKSTQSLLSEQSRARIRCR